VGEREAAALVDVIGDWRDPDDLKRLNGAEAEDYRHASYPYGPRNAPFESIDELGQVIGMSEDLLERLRPALTVFSRRPVPNAGIAPRAVLLVLPGIGAGKIDDALAARGKPAGDAGNAGSALLGTSSSIADLTGRVFTIRARARIGDAAEFMRNIVVRFSDGATGSFWIQDWSDGARFATG